MKQNNSVRFRRGRISRQLALYMMIIVVAVVILVFAMNSIFLESVYTKNKQDTMTKAYNELSKATEEGTIYDANYWVTFEKMCSTNNLSILVVSSDGTVLLSSHNSNEDIFMVNQLLQAIFNYGSGDTSSNADIIESTDNYILEKQHDSRIDGDYLVLWGSFSDGNLVMIRCAMEAINESVNVTNKFLLVIGLMAILISLLLAEFLSKRISRPILELTDISTKMTNLEFESRFYPRRNGNEVDILGQHMNTLSGRLEETIRELKEANLELQHDIEIRDKNETMRKEFLSNVSHELKTPIALIQGYAEGLVDGVISDPEDVKYYCDVIIDESKKMNRMVKEMLSLNQLEYGKSTLNMEHFNIVELIQGVINQTKVMADQYETTLIFDEADSIYVWADEFFTEQVISNYLTNAIHYAKNEKEVRISIQNREKDIRVEVFNTGDPIAKENMDHLWEKFYKVDKARTRKYGGSGIGLSVVKAVMDSFKKDCGVYNKEDGVVFWFELDK
ncbi:MAG: two-component sensor histidine kinase [Lachnospiraceae bacterium]|nr:two-component sensor histidine kinase [Lachnospiraceae bacterium]